MSLISGLANSLFDMLEQVSRTIPIALQDGLEVYHFTLICTDFDPIGVRVDHTALDIGLDEELGGFAFFGLSVKILGRLSVESG